MELMLQVVLWLLEAVVDGHAAGSGLLAQGLSSGASGIPVQEMMTVVAAWLQRR